MIIFGMNLLCFSGTFYKALSTPKVDNKVTVLYKTSRTDKEGSVKYFAEVKDSTKTWTEPIKFGFIYDSMKIGQTITVQNFQMIAYVYGLIAFLNVVIGLMMMPSVWKLLAELD
jgi:hypothetical protein